MPSVSVAIPNYNYGRYLRDCVESVLTQGVHDLQILIIDNASTDNSVELAHQLMAEDDRVDLVVHPRNLGPHATFNEGVDWATGDYFMILCSDDLLVKGSIESMVTVMEIHKDVTFAYGNDIHWVNGQIPQCRPAIGGTKSWLIRDGNEFIRDRCRNPARYIAAGMVLTRTSAQKAAGYFRPELPHTDDFEMLLRLACMGQVAATEMTLGIKRIHEANQTANFVAVRTRDLQERCAALESFFRNEGRALDNCAELQALGRRSIAERAYWCGVKDFLRARTEAPAMFKLAFQLAPRMALLPPFGYLSRTDRGFVTSVQDLFSAGANRSPWKSEI